MALILASASPRRRQLLGMITDTFTVITADVDESGCHAADPRTLVHDLAQLKCRAVADTRPCDWVIGCDTVVELDGAVLGKPAHEADARRMLSALSGRAHLVHTGVCVAGPGFAGAHVETTRVFFDEIPAAELEAYIQTAEPYDKAGGYGIQGWAGRHITGIEGCYFNVMGLPVHALYRMLRTAGAIG